ncbi:hypothetical protein ACHAWT_005486 [Skeletonema menzelii]
MKRTIELGHGSSAYKTTSEAEEDEEEQQTLLSSNPFHPKRLHLGHKLLGQNQRSWPCGIFYLLPALAVVGIVAIVSPFFPLSISTSKIHPDNSSSSPPNEITDVAYVEVEAKKDVKHRQITNYMKGSAIIHSIHITHHAGTSLCSQMSKFGPTPGFACMGKGKNNATVEHPWPSEEAIQSSHLGSVGKTPSYNETGAWVKFWRSYFHFTSSEYTGFGDLHRTNWEYENLVSMIVMRDPLERFLAGGKCGGFQTRIGNDPTEDTQDTYWEYANSDCADNYALRVLANESLCVQGEDTSVACLESAKKLLSRFTFILDQTCLSDSMVALGYALNLTITTSSFEGRLHKQHTPSLRDRFGNDTLYEHVKRRFRRDIELYEWSKKRSIVVCDN